MLHFSIDDNPFTLATDLNGNTTKLPTNSQYPNDKVEFNWDNKLRKAWKGDNFIHVKYDPMGNRVWKHTSEGVNNPVQRKFIVDINSQLPVLLCIADASDPNLLTSTYFYADAQVVHQRRMVDPGIPDVYEAGYYVHDRLGSVRLVVRPIEESGGVVVRAFNSYTYTPYGQFYEGQCVENIANPFKFTGQWHDVEIDQYYLRARQYDPTMMRFTSRDPIVGDRQEPLTLHKYLYCLNTPVNRIDPSGEISATSLTSAVVTGYSLYGHGISLAAYAVGTGDDRFWELSRITFNFMPAAIILAALNPYGPVTNIATYFFEDMVESTMGAVTGMTKWQSVAVDVLAYALYYKTMQYAHKYIGTNTNDMENFIEWMGVDWMCD